MEVLGCLIFDFVNGSSYRHGSTPAHPNICKLDSQASPPPPGISKVTPLSTSLSPLELDLDSAAQLHSDAL